MENRRSHGAPPHIRLRDVRLAFEDRVVFDRLSCTFPRGSISVVLGGSGVGKSTLLRLVAGLIRPDAGRIEVAGREISDLGETALQEVRARIGMLFQGGALLDSLSVFENLALPLRERCRLDEEEIAATVARRLAAVGLEDDVARLLPGQLSGGMLRRAALARAIILEPEILLCDEPFSGLDPVSLKRIEILLATINRRLGITMVVVSHHIASTLRLADHALLLLPERTAAGAPAELRSSADPEVAEFFDEEIRDEDLERAAAALPAEGLGRC